MKHKKLFTIILLSSVFAMNTGIFCKSICLTGDNNMANTRLYHAMEKHHKSHSFIDNSHSETNVCPINHTPDSNNHHHSHKSIPEASIKCECSSDNDSLFDHNLNLSASVDLTPYLQVTSNIQPYSIVFTDNIPIPSEKPPEIFA